MNTQLKKGILEMCILFQLKNGEMYGYEIMKKIKEQFEDVYDGSIYAILRRLNADGYAETFMKESSNGPPRKYYYIAEKGRDYLSLSISEWKSIIEKVGKLGI